MAEPVLVRSSMRTWDFTLLVIVGVGVFVGGWVLYENGETVPGVTLQILGGLCAIGSAVGLKRRIARRQWVRLDADGFTLIAGAVETFYEDSQVRSLALRLKQNFSEGVEKSTTRTLLLWLNEENDDDEPTKLELKSTYKTGFPDPLASLIERLSKRVFDHARGLLQNGSTFAGDGWVLEKRNFVVAAKPEPLHCPLDDIATTGVVDDKLCLWRQGEDEVWTRIGIDSVNAYVLKWLIDERLAERPQNVESSPADGGLGRVVFERKPRKATLVLLAVCAGFTLLAGLLVGVTAIVTPKPMDRIPLAMVCLGMLGASGACVLGVIHCRIAAFRCHQFGLVKRGLFSHRTLRYEHVESFTYQATRHYYNGVYTGTIFVFDFQPDAEHKSDRIRHSVTLAHSDGELDNLRDQIAGIIGARMRNDVQAGRTIVWTPGLTFRGDSLFYKPSGLFGRKDAQSIPLAEIESYKLDQGQCSLFRKGNKKAVVQENMHAKNFFPGFYCMLGLISAAASTEVDYEDAAALDAES